MNPAQNWAESHNSETLRHRKKLVWLIRYITKPSESQLLRKLNAWLHIKSGSFDSLWTSDLNGSNLHEVGFVPTSESDDKKFLLQVGWMRDGKRLWFSYNDSLWTAPAGAIDGH